MFTLKSVLTVLYVLAAVASVDARNHSRNLSRGLARRRCRATPGNNAGAGGGADGGVGNVGSNPNKPTPKPDTDDTPESSSPSKPEPTGSSKPVSGCFPSAGFNMPDSPNGIDLDDWWCSRSSEYAFLGFSYGVDGCPTKSGMTSSFRQMKNDFGARYVRLYGSCDRNNFNSDVVDAAYEAGLGVYALVWFGFNGDSAWKGRLDDLMQAVRENQRAPYVIRNIAFGSEPLYDHAMSPGGLISNINSIRDQVRSKGIEVSLSEMVYKLEQNRNVLDALDNVQLNVLPFFASDATFGSNARERVTSSLKSMANITDKKIVMTQTGWPSEDTIWKANAKSAVSSIASEKAYFDLLDDLCPTFKDGPKGGFGWFAHIFEDNNLRGWGIVRGGQPKFNFKARSKC